MYACIFIFFFILQFSFFQKEKKEGKIERRAFDRDVDMQVNRLDHSRTKSVLKLAHQLDDRFSRGSM